MNINDNDVNPEGLLHYVVKSLKTLGFNIIEEGYISHKPLIAKGKTTQHLNLNEKCYDAFISINCPFWITKWEWKNMNKTQKLKANLQRICETLGGKSYDYQIIED